MRYIQRTHVRLKSVFAGEVGASLVEYSLLIALIAMVALLAIRFFGGELSTAYKDIADTVIANT